MAVSALIIPLARQHICTNVFISMLLMFWWIFLVATKTSSGVISFPLSWRGVPLTWPIRVQAPQKIARSSGPGKIRRARSLGLRIRPPPPRSPSPVRMASSRRASFRWPTLLLGCLDWTCRSKSANEGIDPLVVGKRQTHQDVAIWSSQCGNGIALERNMQLT